MNRHPQNAGSTRLTLSVLAHLLRYPDATFRENAHELQTAITSEGALSVARVAELDRLIRRLVQAPALQTEIDYVEVFDRGRTTSLHLFEHVHGDSRDRGPAMIDLIKTYEAAGLLFQSNEMPDYLPVVLEFASTQPTPQAKEFLSEIAHIVRAIFSALEKRHSPYASVLAAILELAGERVHAVAIPDEAEVDESWSEPAVFGGCSVEGQSKPSAPQPIQIVRKTPNTSGARP
jgi:nitrate reductase delta subunit